MKRNRIFVGAEAEVTTFRVPEFEIDGVVVSVEVNREDLLAHRYVPGVYLAPASGSRTWTKERYL